MDAISLINPRVLAKAGLLPIRNKPVRFAVGPPHGTTSNSWKIWATKSGVYIACRDNFKNTKVSLHTPSDSRVPGRWRVGFTTEAFPHVRSPYADRAWEVWNEPRASLPYTVVAFRPDAIGGKTTIHSLGRSIISVGLWWPSLPTAETIPLSGRNYFGHYDPSAGDGLLSRPSGPFQVAVTFSPSRFCTNLNSCIIRFGCGFQPSVQMRDG
jgi:hypothetical protein